MGDVLNADDRERLVAIRDWRDQVRGKELGQAIVQWDDTDVLLRALDAAEARVVAAERKRDAAYERYLAVESRAIFHDDAMDRAEAAEAAVRAGGEAAAALRKIMDVRWLCDDGVTDRAERDVRGEIRTIARVALGKVEAGTSNEDGPPWEFETPASETWTYTEEKVTDRHALCCRECRERAEAGLVSDIPVDDEKVAREIRDRARAHGSYFPDVAEQAAAEETT